MFVLAVKLKKIEKMFFLQNSWVITTEEKNTERFILLKGGLGLM